MSQNSILAKENLSSTQGSNRNAPPMIDKLPYRPNSSIIPDVVKPVQKKNVQFETNTTFSVERALAQNFSVKEFSTIGEDYPYRFLIDSFNIHQRFTFYRNKKSSSWHVDLNGGLVLNQDGVGLIYGVTVDLLNLKLKSLLRSSMGFVKIRGIDRLFIGCLFKIWQNKYVDIYIGANIIAKSPIRDKDTLIACINVLDKIVELSSNNDAEKKARFEEAWIRFKKFRSKPGNEKDWWEQWMFFGEDKFYELIKGYVSSFADFIASENQNIFNRSSKTQKAERQKTILLNTLAQPINNALSEESLYCLTIKIEFKNFIKR